MKIRNVLAVLLVSLLLLALAACNNSVLTGRYVIVDILDDPEGTTFAELDEKYKAADQKITDYYYIEFQDGGRFVIVLFGEEELQGAYTRSGNVLTLASGGESFDAAIKGKKITYDYETGAKIVFQKEK